jgi:hypothetical protein
MPRFCACFFLLDCARAPVTVRSRAPAAARAKFPATSPAARCSPKLRASAAFPWCPRFPAPCSLSGRRSAGRSIPAAIFRPHSFSTVTSRCRGIPAAAVPSSASLCDSWPAAHARLQPVSAPPPATPWPTSGSRYRRHLGDSAACRSMPCAAACACRAKEEKEPARHVFALRPMCSPCRNRRQG